MRRRFRFVNGKCVETYNSSKPAMAIDLFSSDEMPPTRHPVTGEMYTSKSRFRARTKELGYEEVGTAYANGWEPKGDGAEKRLREKRIEILREALG